MVVSPHLVAGICLPMVTLFAKKMCTMAFDWIIKRLIMLTYNCEVSNYCTNCSC